MGMAFEESKELVKAAKEAAAFLADCNEPVRVVAHYDCDGISSAVIAHEALDRADIPFKLTFVEELDEDILHELAEETFERIVLFLDIGSGQIEAVQQVLADRTVVIADHHEPGDGSVAYHVNPHNVGIDGGEDISGAGVTYLLMRMLGLAEDVETADLIKYAMVGATGDIQHDEGTYLGLNAGMIEDAAERGVLEQKKGIRLYGRTRKSLVDALKYTTEPYLPGISNNESGAVQFLSEIGITLREDGEWRTLDDLSLAEEKEIVHGLLMKGYDVGDLLGDIYLLDNGWEIGEFASLMNACGRLGKPEAGVTICLEEDEELATRMKRNYGRRIGKYLSFVEDNADDSTVVEYIGNNAVIRARNKIHANMIGTITTICQKSDILSGDILVGMAYKDEDDIKISARAAAHVVENGTKMNELMSELCTVCEGDGGGHDAAAGGKIPRSEEDRFIKMLREVVETEE